MPFAAFPRSGARRAVALTATAAAFAFVAGCGGDDEGSSGGGGGGGGGITATDGATIFADAGCESCHTLSAAGASGRMGPNLDDAKPSADTVKGYVTDGAGSMPSFKNRLSAEQIQAVSDYVAEVSQ